jgi:hypothetical protein
MRASADGARGLAKKAALGAQQQPDSVRRVLAGIQVSAADYGKFSEPGSKHYARCVFFLAVTCIVGRIKYAIP